MRALFVVAALTFVYPYVGYPLALAAAAWCRGRMRRGGAESPERGAPGGGRHPSVTVIVAAHNESAVIRARIENLLAQVYPADRLEVIVGSDGSTDDTVALVAGLGHERVRVLDLPRGGRAQVHNACARVARGEVVVFTDAETRFAPDCLRRLVAPFEDPDVGCTSGRLVYVNDWGAVIAEASGWYWRYELLLRNLESRLGSTVAATGTCMAVRRSVFRELTASEDVDDASPLDVLLVGRRVVHVDEALAYDRIHESSRAELVARRRMVSKNLTSLFHRAPVLSPVRFPGVAWKLVSHRVLRYLSPVSLAALLASTLALVDRPAYRWLAGLQLAACLGALVGLVADRRGRRVPVASALFAFALANVGFALGAWDAVRGRTVAFYRPTRTLEPKPAPDRRVASK